MYDDHVCLEAHGTRYCDKSKDVISGNGRSVHKKRIVLDGDITYRDRLSKREEGKASEVTKGCEETITYTNDYLAAGNVDVPCLEAQVCPPEGLGSHQGEKKPLGYVPK